MDNGSKTIRPDYESDEFEVRSVTFEKDGKLAGLVAFLFAKVIVHPSTARVLVICTILGCVLTAYAMNKSPWPAFCICALLVVLCVIGVLLDHFCKTREEISADSSGFESEVSGQT